MRTDLRELVTVILDALPQAAFVVCEDGRIVLRNAAAAAMLPDGATIEQVLRGDGPTEIHWATETAALAEGAGRVLRRNLRMSGKAGRQLVVDVHLRSIGLGPLVEALAGRPADDRHADGCVLMLVEDISPRLSMERRLAAGERLAAAGTLAAQVAHELNNPLDGVMRLVGLAQRTAGPEAGKFLAQAREGLLRMAEIIRGLLAQGRPWQVAGERAEVQVVVEEAVRAMEPRAQAAGVSIVCDYDGRVIGAVDGGVFQVFCNVIKNALDAMPNGGMLRITVRPAGEQCEAEFSDTGVGLSDDEEAERIFEPFYTSKPPGEGSGLGLAICRGILARVGGWVVAAPRPEGGASVTVRLRLHPTWKPAPQEPAS